jgi:polyhydroxyalkanoate synthesis regulator phasin
MENIISPQMIREQRLAAEQEIRKAEERIDQARRHLADLEAVERVILRLQGGGRHGSSSVAQALDKFENPMETSAFSTRNPFKHGTNKAFIWEVLDTSASIWLNANQVQQKASAMRGSDIPMSSISPTLSEMKSEEYIARQGMMVALKTRLDENGAPEGAPEAEEVATSSNESR